LQEENVGCEYLSFSKEIGGIFDNSIFLDSRRPVATVRPFLLRRGTAAPTGGSFKRRSLKLRRNTKESKEIEADCNFV
jgi:hypothetical protein